MRIDRTLSPGFLALAIGAVVGLLAASPALAYVIILKDGSRIVARQRPVPQGKNVVFQDKLGTNKMIPAGEVDQVATDKANETDFRDAYVLGDVPDPNRQAPPPARKPSLSEYIKANKKADISEEGATQQATPREPTTAAVPRTAKEEQRSTKSAKAARDPATQASGQVVDQQVYEAFTKSLETAGLRGARLTPASGGKVRLQAITDTESHVFAALGAAARGLKESRVSGSPVDKVEIYLDTAIGENAGRFQMSFEDAEAILNGKISAARYFVANVMF
jgi:hypothetical protein